MTPTDAKNLLRSKLDEYGVTSNFFDDTTDLYPYLTNAERTAAGIITDMYRQLRRIGEEYSHSPALNALIKQDSSNTTTIGSGYREYSLPTDFMETYRAEYDYSGVTGFFNLKCTLLTFDEATMRESNSLAKATATKPVYYIREKKIGFFPQPIGGAASMYDHWYIALPAAVTSVSSVFTLGPDLHDAIVNHALGEALMKDGQYQLGMGIIKSAKKDFSLK